MNLSPLFRQLAPCRHGGRSRTVPRRVVVLVICILTAQFLASRCARAEEFKPQKPDASLAVHNARLLLVTQSAGFTHGAVKRKSGKASHVERRVTEWGIDSRLFRVDCTQDVAKDFTKQRLQNYHLVMFYTTGNLPIDPETLDFFLNDWLKRPQHGFIGVHSATDTYKNDESYWRMIGGTFNGHPWGSGATVTVSVHDTEHPASRPWGNEFVVNDEIYRFRNWHPENVRVLMSLNMAKTANKQAYHVPIAWVRQHGAGKVFYISLGHNEAVWDLPQYKESILGAAGWMLGHSAGDATPNPAVSQQQHDKAAVGDFTPATGRG